MREGAAIPDPAVAYPAAVHVQLVTEERNRLTAAFRFFLAIPHLLLVGGPAAVGISLGFSSDGGVGWSSGGGLLGAVACLVAVFSWFAIMITGRQPESLRGLIEFYLRWRVRAVSYLMLLRDEYPPFGEGDYPAGLVLQEAPAERDRLTVFFRLLLAVPHLLLLWMVGVLWAFTTAAAWLLILFTGRYPEALYGFALGALAWTTRVEAYVLLLTDEYPPFTLRA